MAFGPFTMLVISHPSAVYVDNSILAFTGTLVTVSRWLKKHTLVLPAMLVGLGVDQLSKYLIISWLPLGTSWPQEGFFRFTHVANTGSAFGLFGGQNATLIVASLIGIVILLAYYRSHHRPGILIRASLGLMLAGAFGNLLDRLLVGHVTDFIDVGPWYIFNLADSSIVVGICMLAFAVWRTKQDELASEIVDQTDTDG